MENNSEVSQKGEERVPIDVKSLVEYNKSQYSHLLDEVMRVEKEAWPEEWQATRDKFESRLQVFPEGFFVAYKDGPMGGVSTSEVVNYDLEHLPQTWDEITDNGLIKKTHSPSGDALYVVSVGVSKNFQGQGIGKGLVEKQKQLAQNLNLKYLFLGARMPEYQKHHRTHPEVSAEDYVKLEESVGRKLDPELRFYESCGLKAVEVIPNYGPDEESENYGVIMLWRNPDFSPSQEKSL